MSEEGEKLRKNLDNLKECALNYLTGDISHFEGLNMLDEDEKIEYLANKPQNNDSLKLIDNAKRIREIFKEIYSTLDSLNNFNTSTTSFKVDDISLHQLDTLGRALCWKERHDLIIKTKITSIRKQLMKFDISKT